MNMNASDHQHEIWLFNPTGGEIMESPGVIVVLPTNIRVVGTLEAAPKFPPGQLRVTQAALDQLGVDGVIAAFADHLAGNWWSEHEECNRAVSGGWINYNIDPVRRVMIVTYPDKNSTLMRSEEY